jgi:hypothetical protein
MVKPVPEARSGSEFSHLAARGDMRAMEARGIDRARLYL